MQMKPFKSPLIRRPETTSATPLPQQTKASSVAENAARATKRRRISDEGDSDDNPKTQTVSKEASLKARPSEVLHEKPLIKQIATRKPLVPVKPIQVDLTSENETSSCEGYYNVLWYICSSQLNESQDILT